MLQSAYRAMSGGSVLTEPADRIAASNVRDADLRRRLELWFEQRGDGRQFPTGDEIDPFAVPGLASSVILYDVEEDLGLKFRVIGEDVKARVEANPIGKPPATVVGDGPYGQFIVAQLTRCAEVGLPVFSHHDYRQVGVSVARSAARIALPFGNGKRVTKLLCFQKFSETLAFRSSGDENWRVVALAFVDRP